MSNAFQRAARTALERMHGGARPGEGGTGDAPAGFEPARLALDVETEGAREIVSFRRDGEQLAWSCTCAQPACEHARLALAFLCDGAQPAAGVSAAAPASAVTPLPAPQDLRRVSQSDAARGADLPALSQALRDVLLAVVRSGVGAGASAAQDEALQRLLRAAPDPLPLGISRWVGRLKLALAARSAEEAARLLAGADLLIEDLAATPRSPEAHSRVLSWLGTLHEDTQDRARLTDRTLIEVAREEVSGVALEGVERRYLVDLSDGAVYREERLPGAPTASLGPCPRVLTVWLAEAEQGVAPQRIRLLQYAVTPLIETEIWQQLVANARREFAPLVDGYRSALTSHPGLCEPFALIAPARIERGAGDYVVDGGGQRLQLSHPDNPAALRFLDAFAAGEPPAFIAGRLHDRNGALLLAPLGAAVMRGGRMFYAQL